MMANTFAISNPYKTYFYNLSYTRIAPIKNTSVNNIQPFTKLSIIIYSINKF